jgi:hypothetical protein
LQAAVAAENVSGANGTGGFGEKVHEALKLPAATPLVNWKIDAVSNALFRVL